MASLTTKQLTAIEKSMVAIIDDPDKVGEIKETFDEFRKALKEGTEVTADDVDARLEVLLEPVAKGADQGGNEMPDDPFAPIFDALYRQLEPVAKKAGVSLQSLQGAFHKAYEASLAEVDAVINATTEATAIELGAGDQVHFGKGRQPATTNDDDESFDEENADMEQVLKSIGVPASLAKRLGSMQVELAALNRDKALSIFEKRAAEAGEPGMAADLLAIHEVDPELCARIEKSLKSKNEVLRKTKGWGSELGNSHQSPAEGAAGPLQQLEGLAKEMIQKGLKGANGRAVSFAKAFNLACEQNPELYDEYNQQKHREIARGGY